MGNINFYNNNKISSSGSSASYATNQEFSSEKYRGIRRSYDAIREVDHLLKNRRQVRAEGEPIDPSEPISSDVLSEKTLDMFIARLNDAVREGKMTTEEAKLAEEVSLLKLDELVSLFGEEGSARLPTHSRRIKLLHETLQHVHSDADKHKKLKSRIAELHGELLEIERKYINVLKQDPFLDNSNMEKRVERDEELDALERKVPKDLPKSVVQQVHDEIEHQIKEARAKIRSYMEERDSKSAKSSQKFSPITDMDHYVS